MKAQMIDLKTRNYGIDALRLVAMLFVVLLHILDAGGVLWNAKGATYALAQLIEVIAFCAVDCYAIISGYVAYSDKEKPYRYEKYASMWIQVFTYSVGISLAFYLIKPKMLAFDRLIKGALPVTTSRYWYFSCYSALFFMIPALNGFIRSISKRALTVAVISTILLYCGYATLCAYRADPFLLYNGYSVIWLVVLYIIGAWMKRCSIAEKMHKKATCYTIIFCVALTWIVTLFLKEGMKNVALQYNSPTILAVAIGLTALFSRMSCSKGFAKAVRFLSPAAFGVYLIHMQDVVFNHFIVDKFIWICDYSEWLTVPLILGCALLIFAVCLTIEKLRIYLFKILKINIFAEKMFRKVIDAFANSKVVQKLLSMAEDR